MEGAELDCGQRAHPPDPAWLNAAVMTETLHGQKAEHAREPGRCKLNPSLGASGIFHHRAGPSLGARGPTLYQNLGSGPETHAQDLTCFSES